ncbi:inducible serine protease inhibitor 2-like isoform X1 [Leptopilina boulardi]|uniref:inducible serine protease inhibitor 2-like isoform X1 n=1 Tax=Leptopilina boulardi TaxID=63433 RepID=UPI0021F6517C|nr:inducible serine protease inhibitor 2-like isoform X1 [Leptopilina boulardi]
MNYKFLVFFLLFCVTFTIEFGQSNGHHRERICRLPLETGSCRANLRRYGYVPSERSCQRFQYGGCDGNENNFRTKDACERFCQGVN